MKPNLTAVCERQQFLYKYSSMVWNILDWIFPPDCPGCEKKGVRFCEDCLKLVQPLSGPICPVCGEPVRVEGLCSDCMNEAPAFDALRAYTMFDGEIRNALHRLKYRNDISLGYVLAPFLVELYSQQDWNIDLVTAVPLSKKRLRSRGYNQTERIARPFAAMVKKPYLTNALQRVVDTKSQIDLSLMERRENVSGAFYANSMAVALKSVIIIDDVSTTGSTLSECARALKEAGAEKVYALTVARAPLNKQKT